MDLELLVKVIILDCETSSLDSRSQEILELSIMDYGAQVHQTWRFRNTLPIDPRTTEVHGITAENLEGHAYFPAHVDDVGAMLRDADVVVGYNIDFDLRAIDTQLARVGMPPWDRKGVHVVDLHKLWMVRERRKLQDAYKRFVRAAGFDGAHGAQADVQATAEVMVGMIRAFGLETKGPPGDTSLPWTLKGAVDWASLANECNPKLPEHIGSKHLAWKNGRVVVNFGKHAGQDLCRIPSQYVWWLLNKAQLPSETIEVLHWLQNSSEYTFYESVRLKYPEPVTP